MWKRNWLGLVFCVTSVLFAQAHDRGNRTDRETDPAKRNEKYLALCHPPTRPGTPRAPGLDAKTLAAYDTLKLKCAQCHNPGSTKGAGSFSDILNAEHLIAKGIVKPGDVKGSKLIEQIEGDLMPLKDASVPLSGKPLTHEEKQALKDWVAGGAKSFSTISIDIPEVGFISNGDLEACMVKDLRTVAEEDRPFVRYLNLGNLYNSNRKGELERTQLALNKLLNSLSWEKEIKNAAVIDGTNTLLRIDVRDYSWSPEQWEQIAKANPYPEPIESAKEKELVEKTGTQTPYLRGDWLVFSASKPPLYHTLLGLANKVGAIGADTAIENRLRIDTAKNERNGRMLRAGFKQSKVTKSNRVIDRHDTDFGGAYWKSADFKTKEGLQNVIDHPLDFERNGGEYIWSLPNGLHGYAVTDAKGNLLNNVPPEIAIDPHRNLKDGLVITGVSCMSCHQKGINRHDDETLDSYLKLEKQLAESNSPNPALSELITGVKKLYKGNKALTDKYNLDERAYTDAVKKTGNSTNNPDPVTATADNFDAPLDIRSIAAELGHETKEVEDVIKSNVRLAQRLAVGANGTVDRDTFNQNFWLLKNLLERPGSGGVGVPGIVLSDPKFDAHFEFAPIAPGTFTMGSPDGKTKDKDGIVREAEPGRLSDEPQHQVTIRNAFEMQTTPVTQSLWEKVMGENLSRFKDPNRPVEGVSWNDVQKFIKKLNALKKGEGYQYRLPTEAEWEFAARGGTKTAYSFGDDPKQLGDFAWFTDNSDNKTQVVGTKKANPLGLFDMHGNVWQLVEDAYQADLGTDAVIDPKVNTGSSRAIRGGSWNDFARNLRSAQRNYFGPDGRFSDVGFRLVRTSE